MSTWREGLRRGAKITYNRRFFWKKKGPWVWQRKKKKTKKKKKSVRPTKLEQESGRSSAESGGKGGPTQKEKRETFSFEERGALKRKRPYRRGGGKKGPERHSGKKKHLFLSQAGGEGDKPVFRKMRLALLLFSRPSLHAKRKEKGKKEACFPPQESDWLEEICKILE